MKREPETTASERKLKFAEAGVLFVLVLGLTLFVGVRFAARNDPPAARPVAAVVAPVEPAAVTAPVPAAVAAADTAAGAPVAAPPRPVTYAEAEQAYFDGQYVRAADLFDRYAQDHPANAWGHYMLGLSEWKAGSPDAAAEAFQAALALKPDHLKSLVNYGRVLIDLHRPDEALAQIEIALAASPESADAHRVLGRIRHEQGDLEGAAEAFGAALRLQTADAWSLNNLGLIRIQQARFAEALAPLAKAAALSPGTACIQNNLGVALERSGHYGEAAAAYARALAADPGYEKADLSLARVGALTVDPLLAPVDLAALADGFGVEAAPLPVVAEVVAVDREVAATDAEAPAPGPER